MLSFVIFQAFSVSCHRCQRNLGPCQTEDKIAPLCCATNLPREQGQFSIGKQHPNKHSF